jgi:hypothetical protein
MIFPVPEPLAMPMDPLFKEDKFVEGVVPFILRFEFPTKLL